MMTITLRHFHLVLPCLLVGQLYAQPIILCKSTHSDVFPDNRQGIHRINTSTLLYCGDALPDQHTGRLIDHDRDPDAFYYVLYAAEYAPRDQISTIGTILYEEKDFAIFKSSDRWVSEKVRFPGNEIVRIRFTVPQRSTPLKKTASPLSAHYNPVINSLVESVSKDSIWNRIAQLSRLERYSLSRENVEGTDFLQEVLHTLAPDTVYTDYFDSDYIPSLIAVRFGQRLPGHEIIVCAHYDVYAPGAPGADDNASGTAGILEALRVLSSVKTERTVRFILFAGEEQGLIGSAAYAAQAAHRGDSIEAVFNLDMISYLAKGNTPDLDVAYDFNSHILFSWLQLLCTTYLPGITVKDASESVWARASDHAPFWDHGFAALFLNDEMTPFGTDFHNDFIHSDADTIGTSANSPEMARIFTQAVVAAAATLAVPVDEYNGAIPGHSSLRNTHSPINVMTSGSTVLINLKGKGALRATCKIFNLSGRKVHQVVLEDSRNAFSLSHLIPGTYILTLLPGTTDPPVFQKIVLNR